MPHCSSNPHAFNRLHYIRHPEPDGLAHFEVWNQSYHAPIVELATADLSMAGELVFLYA
jgi:hypothetical protein